MISQKPQPRPLPREKTTTGAAPAPAPVATPTPASAPLDAAPAPAPEVVKPKRTRTGVTILKKMAVAITELVEIAKDAGLVNPEIDAAATLAGEVSTSSLAPIDARIQELQTAIRALDFTVAGSGDVMKKHAAELGRLQKRRVSITG